MTLADGWMIYLLLALTMYVVLDGYDLGIGVLTLLERNDRRRRSMYELVAWMWDGNESWLVLLALAIWSGLPLVAGIALPALYIPLALMLFSLILRGVSIEMLAQYEGWNPSWGTVFGWASLLAAFWQGAAFGGLLAGVAVRGGSFAGHPWSFLHNGYSMLTGLAAVALYTFAAAVWVYARSDGVLQRSVARLGRFAVVALAAGTALSWALLQTAGSTNLDAGASSRLPVWLAGAAILASGLAVAFWSLGHASGRIAVGSALAVYGGGLTLLLGLLYPRVVPPDITVHAAASPHAALVFAIVGAGIFIPIILTYQSFAYWVFRGKLRVPKEVTVQ